MDGILNISKPRGITSFGVVARVRRLTGEKRVGHAGTLDPDATGVLPVCLGKGTRVVEFLVDTTKVYRARIKLGITTDTGDRSGRIIRQQSTNGIGREHLESRLSSFLGTIDQTPPMYSAVKYRGKRLYELARAGIDVERKSRPVQIYRLDLTEWQPPLATLEIVCGKGTYVRSLVGDLGDVLGCGSTLEELSRLRCGIFDIGEAVSLDFFDAACCSGCWHHLVYPVDTVLLEWPAVVVGNRDCRLIKNGQTLPLETELEAGNNSPDSVYCRAYSLDGEFLGVLRFNAGNGRWQPVKVFV